MVFGFGSSSKRTPLGASACPAGHPERRSIRKKSSKMAHDGLQDGHAGPRLPPRWSKMASKSAKEIRRCLQVRRRNLQDGPR
eukprot:1371672-Pyramimonas_sp.AAC.1